MLMGIFLSLKNNVHPQKGFFQQIIRKFHQSHARGSSYLDAITKKNEEEAAEWLANLPPELEERKREVEHQIAVIRDRALHVETIEVSAVEMKHIILKCETYNSIKRYLNKQRAKANFKLNMDEKRKEKKEGKQLRKKEVNKKFGDSRHLFLYTKPHQQLRRRLERHDTLRPFMFDAIPVVFDMDYDLTMKEQYVTEQNITKCCNINRLYPEPCHIHVTSFTKNEALADDFETQSGNPGMSLHEEGFEEIFPLDKLVYLSPHAPVLRYHNPGDIYIIGGLEDFHRPNEPLSLRKARQMKLRCGSIPFMLNPAGKNIKPATGKILHLHDVFSLVLEINLRHNWNAVIRDFVADWKPSSYNLHDYRF